jgi:Phage protein Gp138 N-terminal domain
MSAPSSREVLDRLLADQRADIHTSFPAQVLAYDAAKQTVDVRPALLREVASDDPSAPWGFEQLPDILDVPIMWPRGGGHVITFPIAVGDWMLVICAEQSTLLWRVSADVPSHPGLVDPHGLNGCVAVPGWYPDPQRLTNVSTTDLVIGNLEEDATVRIKANGEVVIGGAAGAQFVALANRVDDELGRLWDLLTTWPVAASDGGLALQTAANVASALVVSVAAEKVKAR